MLCIEYNHAYQWGSWSQSQLLDTIHALLNPWIRWTTSRREYQRIVGTPCWWGLWYRRLSIGTFCTWVKQGSLMCTNCPCTILALSGCWVMCPVPAHHRLRVQMCPHHLQRPHKTFGSTRLLTQHNRDQIHWCRVWLALQACNGHKWLSDHNNLSWTRQWSPTAPPFRQQGIHSSLYLAPTSLWREGYC